MLPPGKNRRLPLYVTEKEGINSSGYIMMKLVLFVLNADIFQVCIRIRDTVFICLSFLSLTEDPALYACREAISF